MEKKKFSILLVLCLLVGIFAGMGNTAEAKAAATPAPTVKKVTLYTGYKNYNIKIKNLAKDSKVTYSSSDKKVATVTAKGVISPVAKGKAVVTVKVVQSKNTYTSKITVTVKNPYVSIIDKIDTLEQGKTWKFTGKVYGVKKPAAVWSSSDEKVATIDAETGEIKAVAKGVTTIYYKDKTSKKSASCEVEIIDNLADFQIEDGVLVKYLGSQTEVTVPEGVTSIGEGAFYNCDSLESVILPEEITSIGAGAFNDCESLSSIEFPEGLTTIGGDAFKDCWQLENIVLPEELTQLGWNAFEGTAFLSRLCAENDMAISNGILLKGIEGKVKGEVVIPEGVRCIADRAFTDFDDITNLILPEGLISIGSYAFFHCGGLKGKNIVLPEGLTSIGRSAFYQSFINSIVVPESVDYIGDNGGTYTETFYSFIGRGNYKATMIVEPGSYAEHWARKHNYPFEYK